MADSFACLYIRHARILMPDGEFRVGDVQIRDRQILRVSPNLPPAEDPNDKEIDANGLTLLPGVIDPQVHFREPGLEYKEDLCAASWACAKGGDLVLEDAQH